MQTRNFCGAKYGFLVLMILMAPVLTPAENGRDFAGFYDTSNIADLGDQIGMTFTLEVFNFSGGNVAEATIRLENPSQPGTAYGLFTPVSITYRDSVRVSASFTVPQSEYDSWRQGKDPTLRISFHDPAGNVLERPIEVGWMHLPQEVN